MKTVLEAQSIVLEHARRLAAETVLLKESLGRVLAEEVTSNRDHPPYDISAMDGFAVRHEDIDGATKQAPTVLRVVDDIRAGAEPACRVGHGEASRIMTGAAIPEGVDTVIRVEDTGSSGDNVKVFTPPELGANIRPMGENLREGDVVLGEGAEISPAELGILAMVKRAEPLVYRRPSVAILSTGDELEGLDEPFDKMKIPDANSYTVMAGLKTLGIEATLLGIARDSREELKAKLEQGTTHDVLIVSGGVSVGHHDFVRPTLKELGITMHFWRVALRPGHPFAFGTAEYEGGRRLLVFGLPGNPVSSMVCTEQFIVPAIRKMTGASALYRPTVKARLKNDVKDKTGRVHFMRVKLEYTGDGIVADPTGPQGSGILMSMVKADGLMIMPAKAARLEKGSIVTVQLYKSDVFQQDPGISDE